MSLNPTHLYKSSSKHYPFTLRHDSLFKAIWDWIILLLVIYTAIEIPYSAAFLLPHQIKDAKRKQVQLDIFDQIGNSPHYACNIFVDVMFIIDILINFRTTYVDEECEELISNPKRIALRYFKSWFIVDFVAAIPFELITMGGNTKDEATLTLIGLLKTARLLRLVRVSRKLDRYSEYGVSVLFLLMSLFTLAAHWLACIWYAIGYNELSNQAGWLRAMSRQLDIPHNGTDSFVLNTHYITALYFTLSSLTSVGFGNISPNTNAEKLFSVCVMLIGALMYASIFGNLTAIIQRLYSSTARYHRDMRLLREFITFHKIPKHLKETLEEYAKHEWSYTKGVEIDDVLKRFPESLQTDVYYHMYGALFKTFSAFDQASEGCQRALARCLKTRHYLPGHYIIHQGDELADYHFVDKGSIQVICDDQPTLSLNKGDFISCDFNSYLHTPKANASLQANSLCDVIFLSWTDVQTVLHAYPEFRGPFTSQLEVAYNLGGPDTSKRKDSMDNTVEEQAPSSRSSRFRSFFRKQRDDGDSAIVRNGSVPHIEDNSVTLKSFAPKREHIETPSTSSLVSTVPQYKQAVTTLDLNRLHTRLEGIEYRLTDMEDKFSHNLQQIIDLLKGKEAEGGDIVLELES